MKTFNQVVKNQACPLASQLELENESLPWKIFQCNKSHPLMDNQIKNMIRVSMKNIYEKNQ